MKDSIKIQVYTQDAGGKKIPVTDARVALGRRDLLGDSAWPHEFLIPTHLHLSQGFYGVWMPSAQGEPGPGQWLLAVSRAGMSPVVQKLTIELAGSVLRVKPGWGKRRGRLSEQAATVTIINVGQPVPSVAIGTNTPPQYSTVNVLLQRRFEVVGMAAHNHLDNADYVRFCKGRRHTLFKAGVTNQATIFTRFECDTRARVISVKSAKPGIRDWVELERRVLFAPSDDVGKKRAAETAERELGIEDLYQHLSERGSNHPGTIIEAGVFSHGWVQGPILWNKSDRTDSVTERTLGDLDGRQKDWLVDGALSFTPTGSVTTGPTMKKHPSIGAAFASTAARAPKTDDVEAAYVPAFRLWGCVHMLDVVNSIRGAFQALKQGRPRDEFFDVRLEYGGRESTTLDHTKRHVAMFALSKRFARSLEKGDFRMQVNYPGAAAQFLKTVPCFGAPPGLGASYRSVGGELSFRMDDQAKITGKDAKGNTIVGDNENHIPYQWYRSEFGAYFVEDKLHYINYNELLKVAASLPDPGWATQRWAKFRDKEQGAAVLRIASGLEVHYLPSVDAKKPKAPLLKIFGAPKPHQVGGVNGHLFAWSSGHAERLSLRGPAHVLIVRPAQQGQSRHGLFVGSDGRTLLMVDAGGGSSAVASEALPIVTATFKGFSFWGPPYAPNGTVVGGVLQKVAPKWYW